MTEIQEAEAEWIHFAGLSLRITRLPWEHTPHHDHPDETKARDALHWRFSSKDGRGVSKERAIIHIEHMREGWAIRTAEREVIQVGDGVPIYEHADITPQVADALRTVGLRVVSPAHVIGALINVS